MLTDELFIEPLTFEKSAEEYPLGEPQNWEHEVTKYIYDKIPFAAKYNTVLQFHKKDEKAGYGYGSLIINNSLIVPIIIHQKMGKTVLSPFDVFHYEDNWYPLTPERIERHLFVGQPHERVAKPKEEVGRNNALGNRIRPPSDGREVIASASLLDVVLPTARMKDLKSVINEIEKEARLLASYRDNDTFGFVRKIAVAANAAKDRDVDKMVRQSLPINIVEVEKTASGYTVTATSDYLHRPEIMKMSPIKIKKVFGDKILKEASKTGYAILEIDRPRSNVYIVDDLKENLSEIKDDGECTVKLALNKNMKGHVFSNVVDFDLNKTAKSIFTDGKSFAYQETIVGKDFTEKVASLETAKIEDGLMGCFVYESPDSGKTLALEPIQISAIMVKQAEGIGISAKNIYGEPRELVYTPFLRTVMKKEGKYYIPSNMKFVRLGNRINLSTDIEGLDKIAKLIDPRENSLDLIWTGMQFSIKGMDDCEIFDSEYGLPKTAAKGMLVKLGATTDEADLILRRTISAGRIKAAGFRELSCPDESHISDEDELVKKIKKNTVKLAAFVQDEDTVDKVLSLNFVNPQNVKMFMDYIPAFEESVSNLASMLVASRLGMKEVEEQPVKDAMSILDEVLTSLKETFNVEDTLKNIKD